MLNWKIYNIGVTTLKKSVAVKIFRAKIG